MFLRLRYTIWHLHFIDSTIIIALIHLCVHKYLEFKNINLVKGFRSLLSTFKKYSNGFLWCRSTAPKGCRNDSFGMICGFGGKKSAKSVRVPRIFRLENDFARHISVILFAIFIHSCLPTHHSNLWIVLCSFHVFSHSHQVSFIIQRFCKFTFLGKL